jgi:DNA-binding ferritin-like protein (Dps family)
LGGYIVDNEKYKNYINRLENEYASTFAKIEVYINGSSKLNSSEKNSCFLQILDTFLAGQEESKSVKEITGVDLKKYCNGMIYGETIYIYKSARVCFILLGALFYVLYMQFFVEFFMTVAHSKGTSLIFKPMNFGIGDMLLMLGYICIPKLISLITRNYFENPVRCKKVKRYTYYIVWFITIGIYTFSRDFFKEYVIVIPFSNIVLILIYLTLISLVVWFLIITLEEGNREDKKAKLQNKYFKGLSKKYDTYIKKCKRRSKSSLDWDEFKRKKAKSNSLVMKIFYIYSIIFLVFAILIGRGMLVKGIDVVGIIILVGISFIEVVIVSFVRVGIQMNKGLAQIES